MAFTRITDSELASRGATTLANTPTIGATALKQEFDAPAKQIVAPAVNRLATELEAITGAASIGAVAPESFEGGTVQEVLASMASSLSEASELEHSHENKELLDTYTQTEEDLADAVDKKHSHANKEVLDDIDDADGRLTYNGKELTENAFNKVSVGSTDIVAVGDDTIKLKAGANVVLTPDPITKEIEIASAGGSGGSSIWGSIIGTLEDQTDLKNALDGKADDATTLAGYGITDAYTKSETDTLLDGKADEATTLAGYGITDAYTKTETENLIDESLETTTNITNANTPEWTADVYSAGTYKIKDNKLYRAKSTTSSAWVAAEWEEVSMTSLKNDLANTKNSLTYHVGDSYQFAMWTASLISENATWIAIPINKPIDANSTPRIVWSNIKFGTSGADYKNNVSGTIITKYQGFLYVRINFNVAVTSSPGVAVYVNGVITF